MIWQSNLIHHTDVALMLTSSARVLRTIWNCIKQWDERARQRHHLANLDDHLLKDIGLTPDDVRRECSKSFWRF